MVRLSSCLLTQTQWLTNSLTLTDVIIKYELFICICALNWYLWMIFPISVNKFLAPIVLAQKYNSYPDKLVISLGTYMCRCSDGTVVRALYCKPPSCEFESVSYLCLWDLFQNKYPSVMCPRYEQCKGKQLDSTLFNSRCLNITRLPIWIINF